MKRFLIPLIFCLLTTFNLSAQKTKDALYLKNGSKIYGKLLEITDNKYKMQTSDNSIYIFDSGEVEKFAQEIPTFNRRKSSGPGFVLEAGVLAGAQSNDLDAPFSFNILLNYTLETRNLFSLGSGVEFLNRAFTPLFFEYKRLLGEKKTTPFIFFRGGGLVHIGGDDGSDNYQNPYNYPTKYKGGPSFGLGTGISWAREENETYLSFAYRYARTSYSQRDYYNGTSTYKNNYNRLEIKFGFKF